MNNIEWLCKWYLRTCDGYWEHQYGIEILSLDNPGWSVKIELEETAYSQLADLSFVVDNSADDWVKCFIQNQCFYGIGDGSKLDRIISIFRNWITSADGQ